MTVYRIVHSAVDVANRGAPPIAAADGGKVTYAGCLRQQ